jgi:PAS domain S-box-containing protein
MMTRISLFLTSIRGRVVSSFAIVLAVALVMAVGGYYQLDQVRSFARQITPGSSHVKLLHDFALSASSLSANLERYLSVGNKQLQVDAFQDLENMKNALKSMQKNADGEMLLALQELESASVELERETLGLLEIEPADLASRETDEKIASVLAQIDSVQQLHQELFARTLGQLQDIAVKQERITSDMILQYLLTGALVCLVVAVALLIVTRGIVVPLANLVRTAAQIADGDLDRVARVEREDEIGALAQAFNAMTSRLHQTIESARARSDELAEHTHDLEASLHVTSAASERTSPDELLGLVVNLIRDQFHFYHVQVYIVETSPSVGETSPSVEGTSPSVGGTAKRPVGIEGGAAVLRESTGYAGRQLLDQEHHIPLDLSTPVTQAIHQDQPVLLNDVSQAPDFSPHPLLPDTRAELVIPLKIGERIVGALDVQARTAGRFTPSLVALFQSMAGQIAFLFENSELVQRVTEQTEALTAFAAQLRTAAEVAGQLGAILDPERLLQEVVTLLQVRFGLYHAHVYLLKEDRIAGKFKRELVVRAGSGQVGQALRESGHSIPLDREKSLVARAARERRAVLVTDTSLDSDFMPHPLLPQTRSEIAVPLIAGDKTLGVLDVQDDRVDRFSQADEDTFSTLAGQIATAIENARLFEEQQRAEKALRESQELLQSILDNATTVIYVKDTQGRYLLINRQFEMLFNVRREDLVGKTDHDIFPPELADKFRENDLDVLRAGTPVQSEEVAPHKDGLLHAYISIKFPLLNPDGTPYAVGGISTDITDRQQAEQALRRERARTDALYAISRELNAARDEDELLQVLARPAIQAGATQANLMYVELDQDEQPEWSEVVAAWQHKAQAPGPMPVGTRLYLPESPFIRLWTSSTDKALLIADAATDERVDARTKDLMTQIDVRAMVSIPLTRIRRRERLWQSSVESSVEPSAKRHWVGVVNLSWDTVHEFSEQETDVYDALPALATPAVASRRLLIQQERALTETLYQISSDLNAARDKDELLQALAQPAIHAGAFGANLMYIDLDQDGQPEWSEVVATWQRTPGEMPMPPGTRFYLPEFPFSYLWIGSPNEPQLLADVASDERLDENTRDAVIQSGGGAVALVPLVQAGPGPGPRSEPAVKRHWIGLLTFTWSEAHEFSPQEAEVYHALIGLATPAVSGRRLMDNLEHMVIERTQQLSTASDIAGQVNAILDPDELLNAVIPLLKERFGLYHAHVYTLDERVLKLRAGYGEPGRIMREQGHNIPLDQEYSLVARAARTGRVVSSADTQADVHFLPNPLLPDTRSEVAVPLVVGDQVLGVFDVQHDTPHHFTQAYLDTFSTLAGQIATALQNAGLFEQTQARLRVSQALVGAQTEEQVLDAMIQVAGFYPEALVAIFTFDQDAGELAVVTRRIDAFKSDIVPAHPPGARYERSQFTLLQLISPDTSFVSADFLADERTDPTSRALADQLGLASVCALPMTVGDEWLGVVVAESRQKGLFDERRLHLYQSLADQGAIFLRTARLFDESLETAERLREVDRIKNEFIASMSHELRTPLNSIIGFAEVLLMGISGPLSSEAAEDAQAIFDNGRNLLNIVDDVLDLTKIEAGTLILNLEHVEIAPLLREIQLNSAGLLADKPVEMRLQVEDDLPSLEADPMRIGQVVNNLVSNAIKFTEKGTITLRAYTDDDWVCIEVQDTGVGINTEDLGIVFEKFRQLDGSHARRVGGAGLGLAITRELVNMHGGTLEVQSQPDQGSTFSVRLPIASDL